jgi:hypothetical protein
MDWGLNRWDSFSSHHDATLTAAFCIRLTVDFEMSMMSAISRIEWPSEDRRLTSAILRSVRSRQVQVAAPSRISRTNKPGLRSVDEAIRRRFHLVPFTVTIPADQRDPNLSERLKLEWPGILQWMIDGCLEWQREGLCPPEAVSKATAHYLESQDAIAAWLDDACERDPDSWEKKTDLLASWKAWANNAGEEVLSRSRFYDALENRGFTASRRSLGDGFHGIRLARVNYEASHWNR